MKTWWDFQNEVLTLSKSYWQDSVAAFPMTTASGTKIFNSFKQTPRNDWEKIDVWKLLVIVYKTENLFDL